MASVLWVRTVLWRCDHSAISARLSSWRLLPVVALMTFTWTFLGGTASATTNAIVLAPGHVFEAASQDLQAHGTEPSDGRLRGPDYTATVTRVAWPQSIGSVSNLFGPPVYVADARHRLVAFTLSVTQPPADSGQLNSTTEVTGSVEVGGKQLAISLDLINGQIARLHPGSAEATGVDSFVTSVPSNDHAVVLELSEGGFTQRINLWTLKRLPSSPTVLYRAPTSSSVTGAASGPFHLSFTNPADGFSSTDNAQVTSAQLTFFAPGTTLQTPKSPEDAYLVLGLQSSYPDIPYGQPNSGHFFSSFNPMAGTELTFTPTGGSAVDGLSNTSAFVSTNAASDDDGLFDAVYFFTVPATTTGGTLTVNTGQQVGDEYTGFTGTGNSTLINLTASATVTLSFPAVASSPPAQKTPPWVGAPLPAPGTAAASASTSPGTSSPGGGFPIWLAAVLLFILAAAVIVAQRLHARRSTRVVASPNGALVADEPAGDRPLIDDVADTMPASVVTPVTTPAVANDSKPEQPPAINILGRRQLVGFQTEGRTPVLEALATYLVCHDAHHLNADQIALGMWPLGRPRGDISRKTVHNYLSGLRGWIGAEHLPDAASAGGYLIEGIGSDWATLQRLAREADRVDAESARALRMQALKLVRGKPFEGLSGSGYDWVEEERLVGVMTKAIVDCATRLGNDLMDAGEFRGAQEAAEAGLRGAPNEYILWELGARAISAQGERSALEHWLSEAGHALTPADAERIRRDLGHDPSSDS